jgi:TonB family protein
MIHRFIITLGVLLAVSACATAAPPAAEPEAEAQAQAGEGVRLLNASDVVSRMRSAYPQLLWDAGVTGIVVVELTLNADGTVQTVEVRRSTHDHFSDPARRAAGIMRFSPPAVAGRKVWVSMHFNQPTGSVELMNP